jgi:phosphotriesterase-related protein
MTKQRNEKEVAGDPLVYTVRGPVPARELGFTLPHEHIMVDFGGAETAGKHRYDAQNVIEVMQPYLQAVAAQGMQTFFECTPNFLGRDPEIFRTLSEQTGLNIVTNTGLYNNQYLPEYAKEQSAEQLAEGWVAEFTQGIEVTGIKPGFIKTAVNPQPTTLDLKLIHAAALAHNKTGLTIATHTCTADAATEIVKILDQHQVDPSRWIFVHAHVEEDFDRVLALAQTGIWIELDGLAWGGDEDHAQKLIKLLEHGYEDQILLSQDAGWYNIGEENGGKVIPYTRLQAEFLPLLKAHEIDNVTIDKITRLNPARAFGMR